MAKQPQQQQMKTSFLFIQLQAPPARAHPAQSPAAAASKAAPRGLEEVHIFPSPRTGFLAGWDLRHTQSFTVSPSSLLPEEGAGTEGPASFSCYSLKEKKEGEAKPQNLGVRRGGVCGSPHCRRCLAPASRKLGWTQPLSCGLASPASAMSNGSGDPSMGWKDWPLISAPQELWNMDLQARNALGCSIQQATLVHAADRGERAMLRKGAATHQLLLKNCDEGLGTTVLATRARLYRYYPTTQISQSCPAPPAALPLKKVSFKFPISDGTEM
uniref:Uncharacterized protein n=1 Tax=Castor canadensis TaxID=51338 RepID=A0A8C0XIR0_CASCN